MITCSCSGILTTIFWIMWTLDDGKLSWSCLELTKLLRSSAGDGKIVDRGLLQNQIFFIFIWKQQGLWFTIYKNLKKRCCTKILNLFYGKEILNIFKLRWI